MLRRTAAALALTLGVTLAGPAATASTPYAAALSQPREDSYYPAKGDPGVDALKYRLALTWLPASRTLQGTATIVLRATTDADGFQLDLAGSMKVRRVTVDGVSVSATHPGKLLKVAAPVEADTRYRVKIVYAGTPATVRAPSARADVDGLGWHTGRNGQTWTVQQPFGAYTWYPVNDHPSDKALYDVQLDVPQPWIGISNGQMVKRGSVDGRTVTRFTNRDPIASYAVTVAIGAYKRYTQTGPHGLPITQWVPRSSTELVNPLRMMPEALRFLEARLGPYPLDRVGVVVTPGEAAVEGQTMIGLGRGNYRYGNRDVRETMVHQLAHAWYGNTVTPDDWSDVWMNDGMATYLQARFSAAKKWSTWRSWQRRWARDDDFWRELYGPPGGYTAKYFGAPNVHQSAALLLDRLRLQLGTATFNELARRWPQEHRNSNQDRADYERWLEARTGRDLGPFLKTWLLARNSPA